MAPAHYDVVVVGAGPAGSLAALTLARGGTRVALVDKASRGRDKACGDLIGPRGVQLLDDVGVTVPGARTAGDMLVAGPSGRRVLLPAREGRTYPGHALVVPRARFDDLLRAAALDAGALDVPGRVGSIDGSSVRLDDGRVLRGDIVIGADGATSVVAQCAGLIDASRALWGFAVRAYIAVDVELPLIALWNVARGRGFPGYGWLFPSTDGANVGLGIGVGPDRTYAYRATRELGAFCTHLLHIGALDKACAPLPRTLGGWLKMGMVGTTPAARNVLLVGDAAGLVNPLQGEGIAQALLSGHAAASCVLATPGTAATAYLDWIRTTYGSWFSATAPVHARLVQHPRVIARVSSAITAPVVGRLVASTWALYWNDLARGAAPSLAATAARALHAVARTATSPSRVCRQLRNDLAPQTPSWSAASETSAF